MTIWVPDIASRPGPKYRVIADSIDEAVADGTLGEGARLPPQRDLAYALGVSLNTVTRAYGEAMRRGVVDGEIGRGTFVRGRERADSGVWSQHLVRPEDGPVDFRLNLPAIGRGARALAATLAELGNDPSLERFLDYEADGGISGHAEAGAGWIGRLGWDVAARDVMVTTGAQHGVLVSLMAATRPGDTLLAEELSYAPLKQMAHFLGLKLHPVGLDEQGLRPDKLDAACRQSAAKALYCLPTLQTPTTATMPEDRRREICRIAGRHDLTIIEDDVFGFLPDERPPPLASFARERSLFVTGVSKSLAPGLRVGYVRAPERYRASVCNAVAMSCWMPPPLMAEIATRWINSGVADRLNGLQRREAQARQKLAARTLRGFSFQAHASGLNIWLQLPEPWRADAFQKAAEARGVLLLTGENFAIGQTNAPQAVRLCLGYETSRERVAAGLEVVAGLLENAEPHGSSLV